MGTILEIIIASSCVLFFYFFFIFLIFLNSFRKCSMAIGNCTICGKAIVRAANLTEYKGAKYHTSCFRCASCKGDITGPEGFINHLESLYCKPCYDKELAEKCQKCKKSLTDGGIRFQEKPYHKDCFHCGGCNVELAEGKFFVNSDTPYCSKCHTDKFSERCSLDSCGKPIPAGSQFVEVDSKKYHKNCFKCTSCEKVISDQPFVKDAEGNFCADCADS